VCTLPGYLACRDALSTRPLAKVHCPYSLADAGTLEEASAWRWLRVHGAAVKRLYDLTVVDKDVERLSILQLAMPALERVRGLKLRARPGDAPATRAFLVGAARAVARCPCLRTLQLLVELAPKLGEQLPDTFGRELADACTLMNVSLRIMSRAAEARDRPAAASVSHLVTGLAGLSRLRALSLTVENACMEGAVPACMSCLAQLTTLSLSGFHGLRCAPGWAHLPALVYLGFKKCEFSVDSDAALPGMDMLVSLRSLTVDRCPSLRTWPTSLWRLGQLSSLTHGPGNLSACELARLPRGALPAAELPASALCFPAMTNLTLAGHNLLAFPRGVLGMTRLVHLDLDSAALSTCPRVCACSPPLRVCTLAGTLQHQQKSGAPWMSGPWAAWLATRSCASWASQTAACCSVGASRLRQRTPAWSKWNFIPRILPVARPAAHAWALPWICCSGGARTCSS